MAAAGKATGAGSAAGAVDVVAADRRTHKPVEEHIAHRPSVRAGSIDSMAGSSPATIVPRNTASTSPLTDLKAALGLSASLRAASSDDVPDISLPNNRAACAVSQGPAITRPIRITSRPGRAGLPIDCLLVCASPTPNRAMPASSGTIRHALGGGGVTRRLTPSGEILTLRSESSDAIADAAGTAMSTAR